MEVFNDCADVSYKNVRAASDGLVALSDPTLLISVITAVMLIGLDHSLDCIVHNDEKEWASILWSISIWIDTKSSLVPGGYRLPIRVNPIDEI